MVCSGVLSAAAWKETCFLIIIYSSLSFSFSFQRITRLVQRGREDRVCKIFLQAHQLVKAYECVDNRVHSRQLMKLGKKMWIGTQWKIHTFSAWKISECPLIVQFTYREDSLNKLKKYSKLFKGIMLGSLPLVLNSSALLDVWIREDVNYRSPPGSPQTQGANREQLREHQAGLILLQQLMGATEIEVGAGEPGGKNWDLQLEGGRVSGPHCWRD